MRDLARFLSDTGDRRHELAGENWGNPSPQVSQELVARHDEFAALPPAMGVEQLDGGSLDEQDLPLAQALRHSLMPLTWSPRRRQCQWGVPSGGDTRGVQAHVVAISADRMLEGELDPRAHALRVVSRGPRAPGARIGTTVTLRANPARTARRYGDFGVQLMLLEAGAAAEQIALTANAVGLDVALRYSANPRSSDDYPLATLEIDDAGLLARLNPKAARWWAGGAAPVSPVAHSALRSMCREDDAPVRLRHRTAPPFPLFRATMQRSSGSVPAGPRLAGAESITTMMTNFGALGGADPSLELRFIDQTNMTLHRASPDGASIGESLAALPGILETVTHGARGASVVVAAALSLAGGWSAYRQAMLAAGAAMQRLCLAAAAAGLWARPRREVPDRVLATLFPYGRYALIQVDVGPIERERAYDIR